MGNYDKVDQKYGPTEIEPRNSDEHRFFIGKKGIKDNLFVIGMNPSKANLTVDDPTILIVINAAKELECDGWFLMNLYPSYSTNLKDLDKYDDALAKRNFEEVKKLLIDNSAKEVLVAWGNLKTRQLRRYEYEMLQLLKDINVKAYYYDKMTNLGYPYHPLPLGKPKGWQWISSKIDKKFLEY